MLERLTAELESLDKAIEEQQAQLNQLIGARTFCQFAIDLYREGGEGDQTPSPKTDEQSPQETIDLAANGIHFDA